MVQLSGFFRHTYLVALLLGLLMGAHADIIDDESCSDVLYRDRRGRVRSHGDLTHELDKILIQTEEIATDAAGLMEDIEKGKAGRYASARAKKMVRALQPMTGQRHTIDEQSWKDTASEFTHLCVFLFQRGAGISF
jgi:hypothetical protein